MTGTSGGAGLELMLVMVQRGTRSDDGLSFPFSNNMDQGLPVSVVASRGHPRDNWPNNTFSSVIYTLASPFLANFFCEYKFEALRVVFRY